MRTKVRLARLETGLSSLVKKITDHSKTMLLFVDHLCYFCLVFDMRVSLLMPCGHLLGKG